MDFWGAYWDITPAKHLYDAFKRHVEPEVANWLYGDWDEEKYRTYTALNAVPGVSDYMDYLLDRRADEEYLRRYGMDYSDIHDPRKLRQTHSGSRMISSVSSNVSRLYS